MRIVIARPPLYDLINSKFRIAGKSVFFAWGDVIYNPAGVQIPPSLIAHESVHGRRQGSDIEGWWGRYIDDPQFRLAEEIPAHIAEYRFLCENAGRHDRRAGLAIIAKRLSGPLYGGLISFSDAKKLLAA